MPAIQKLKNLNYMYTPLIQSISDRLCYIVDMQFQTLNEMHDNKERKKRIRQLILDEDMFSYKVSNPYQNLIPPTKIFSKKNRIIQKVIQNAMSYFENLSQKKKQQKYDPVENVNQIKQDIKGIQL